MDVLGRLVDKSLVVVEQGTSGRRYRLLEPVRQYAHRLLRECGDEPGVRSRHATCYAALAERAAPLLRGPEQIAWLDRLEAERDNVRAALEWITAHGKIDDGLRLTVAMTPYWEARGYLSEGRRWLDVVLAKSPAGGASPTWQMQALESAGALAQWQGSFEDAEKLLCEALASARELDDRRREAETLAWLVAVCRRHGTAERALSLSEESVRLGREVGDQAVLAFALLNHGVTVFSHGDRVEQALPPLEESLGLHHRLGDTRYIALTATMLGWATFKAGDLEQAARLLREGALALRSVGDRRFLVEAVGGIARVAEAQGELARAVTWLGATDALLEELGISVLERSRADHLSFHASLQGQLTAAAFDEAYADGKAMSLDQLLGEVAAAP